VRLCGKLGLFTEISQIVDVTDMWSENIRPIDRLLSVYWTM